MIEPPFAEFSRYMIDELQELHINRKLCPLIAHIDRYLYFDSYEHICALFRFGRIKGQINADAMLMLRHRKKVIALLNEGYCSLLGSDAHDMAKRSPHLDVALAKIEKHCGAEMVSHIAKASAEFITRVKA